MDIYDLWETSAAESVSFGVEAAAQPPEPMARWRLDLSADGQAAARQLERGEQQVQSSEAALALVPQKLDQLLQARHAASGGGLAFDAGQPQTLSRSERELRDWLDQMQRGPGLADTRAEASVSFDTATSAQTAGGPGWGAAKQQFDAGVDRLQRLLLNAAWVETRVEGELLGETIVGWTGDTRTVWGAGAAPARLAWHTRSMALALASRATLMRTFFLVTQNAVKLSAMLAVPGGVVLALPVAWKFVNQVLAEVGEYQKLTHSKGA